MMLPWLTWAALMAAASAADATPEELLLLETQSTALPHRLLQLLADGGQLQQRQRRLRQSAGFKPWSGKRSHPPAVVRDELTSGEDMDMLHDWPEKRGRFKPWTGKRSGFKPWTGKRNAFKPWTGKRDSFKPWTGKRDSFKPWTGKRESFKPWTGKRDAFKPWTGKRVDSKDCIETEDASEPHSPHKTDIANMLMEMEAFAKRVAARSSDKPKSRDQPRHVVRQRFKPWSGKRSSEADDTTEEDDRIQF